jgi:uncharacterized membrane protein
MRYRNPGEVGKLDEKIDSKDLKVPDSKVASRRIKTVNLTLTGALAGVYAVATIGLGSISFGLLNLRLSNMLIGAVPILGWPGVFGIALGVFLGNIGSTLGPLDLISSLFSLAGLIAIHLLKGKSVLAGLSIYSLILSLWVGFEISFITHGSYLITFVTLLPGISFVTIGLGYLFYKALIKTGIRKRVESVLN